jgi:hypothetical protein
MPKISEESHESLESVAEVVRLYFPDLVQACKLLIAMEERLPKDARRRTSFRPYAVHIRRIAVIRLSNLTCAEIANRLRVPLSRLIEPSVMLYGRLFTFPPMHVSSEFSAPILPPRNFERD